MRWRDLCEALTPLYGAREARSIARLVACEAGGLTPLQLLLEPDRPVALPDQRLEELIKGRPVQYVLGQAEFCGLRFRVREGALIPRPETEELVRRIAAGAPPRARILDVGTGSGAIAVALKKLTPEARVTAVDISDDALALARENAARLGAEIQFLRADALRGLPLDRPFDIIVSNPPYIPTRERASMHPNVTEWEPSEALFVPDDDPLLFYRAIAREARKWLSPGGALWFEVHEAFAPRVATLLAQEGFPDTRIFRDLNDKLRVTCSRKG